MNTLLRWLVPSTPIAVGLLAFVGVCLTPNGAQLLSWDTPLHLYLGEHMLRDGARVTTDPGIWPAQGFYLDHEWIQQSALAGVHQAFGFEGLVLYAALGIGVTFWLVAAWMRERGITSPVVLGLLTTAFFLLRPFYYARPFLATWILAVLWTYLLDRLSRGDLEPRRWLAFAVPLMWVWANLHGGFLLGFVLLGIFGLAQLWRIATTDGASRRAEAKLLLWMATGGNLCLIASTFNAYGVKLHFHFARYLASSDLISRITEWRSPAFHEGEGLPLLLWVGFAVSVWVVGPGRLTPFQLLWSVGMLLAALKARRNVPMFVMLTLPVVGLQLEALLAKLAESGGLLARPARWLRRVARWTQNTEHLRGGAFVAAVVVVIAVYAIGVVKIKPIDLGTRFPVAAARFIEDNPEVFAGQMFNRYQWGGYLAWELLPTHRVFINGLQDHYGEAHYRTYRGVVDLIPGWDLYLKQAGVDWVIFGRNTPLTAALGLHPDWQRVYQDGGVDIFVREEAPSEEESPG